MRIREIAVDQLFGRFDHRVPLNLDDRITIVIGPNGVGKTILLRMVDWIFNGRYGPLTNIPFEKLRISLDDGYGLELVRSPEHRRPKEQRPDRNEVRLTLHYNKPGVEKPTFHLRPVEEPITESVIEFLDHYIPDVERIGPARWRHGISGEILQAEDLLERYTHVLPPHIRQSREEPEWWTKIKNAIPVRLVETQRLLSQTGVTSSHPRERRTVQQLAVSLFKQELSKRIQEKLAQSVELSQSLDRTFPARLVNGEFPPDLSDEALQKKLGLLEGKRSRLKAVGLVEKDEEANVQIAKIDDKTRSVLSAYVQDVEKKLTVFDEMADKIELFTNILNDHFAYKSIVVGKAFGFHFVDKDSGSGLSPDDLSSGEQHEVVLLYELLFRVRPNSLILIDEPELSLHVEWQRQFLADLEKITRISSLDVLVATHSPQIIHDRWDLAKELKGANK